LEKMMKTFERINRKRALYPTERMTSLIATVEFARQILKSTVA